MRVKIIMVISIILLLICYFSFLSNEKDFENKIEFMCDGIGQTGFDFYDDGEYIYYYTDVIYIMHNEKRMMIPDALKKKIITIEDIDKAAKENPKCQYYKRSY